MVFVFCYQKEITSFHSPCYPSIRSLSPNIFSDPILIDVAYHVLETLSTESYVLCCLFL